MVRTANTIVGPDESVLLVDFEQSFVSADDIMLTEEEDEVRNSLKVKKNRETERI